MGVGDSLEATFPLAGPLPAGRWGLVGDGILAGAGAQQVEVRFEVLLRPQGGPLGSGQAIVRFVHTFRRDPNNEFRAVRYDDSVDGPAVPAGQDDLLVLRVTVLGGDPNAFYILNGDGSSAGGRIPRIDLPR